MDVGVFYIYKGKREEEEKEEETYVVKWGILVFLLRHFTDG
jgi:hypothetical protein